MKVVELTRIAASAEALRIKRQLLRYGRQAAYLVAAAVFGLFALAVVHVLLWMLCDGPWNTGRVWATVIVLAVDVAAIGILVLLGRGRLADPIEVEARITRDRSLSELRNAVALTAVTGPAGRFAGRTAWSGVRRLLRRRRR